MKINTPPPKDWRKGQRFHKQGWTQKDIAAALGVAEGTISQWIIKDTTQQRSEVMQHRASLSTPAKSQLEQHARLPCGCPR